MTFYILTRYTWLSVVTASKLAIFPGWPYKRNALYSFTSPNKRVNCFWTDHTAAILKDFRLDFMPGGQEYVEPAAADVIESPGSEVQTSLF